MSLLDSVFQLCDKVEPLAEGGQKRVYSALHPVHGAVVIKHGEYRVASTLERITREVELLRELDSPYFPRHYDFLIEPIKREFLVIEEHLDASELSVVADRFTDDPTILRLIRKLVCALDQLWSRNVVHRDIKPANILITPSGDPRVIDLGIARFLDDSSLTADVLPSGPGTPLYAAPEQLINRKAMIDQRTDFFLLGVLALELHLGHHPFDPFHVGGPDSLIDNVMQGHFVQPREDSDPVLAAFVRGVVHPKSFRRIRDVPRLRATLNMDRVEC